MSGALETISAVLGFVVIAVLGYGTAVRRLGVPVPLLLARRRVRNERTPPSGWGAWADAVWAAALVAAALAVVAALL